MAVIVVEDVSIDRRARSSDHRESDCLTQPTRSTSRLSGRLLPVG